MPSTPLTKPKAATKLLLCSLLLVASLAACSKATQPPAPIEATPGVQVLFDTQGRWKTPETFFDFPYPSDLRLTADKTPDVTGFPNPEESPLVANLLSIVDQRPGFPVLAVGYFRFSQALQQRDRHEAILPSPQAPIHLIDIEPTSPTYAKLHPTAASQLESGTYVPSHLLAISAYPGTILAPNRRYAFVVMRSARDATGQLLGVPKALNELKAGKRPAGQQGDQLQALYKPLWPALQKAGIDPKEVAAATIFRTGDVVATLARLAEALRQQHKPEVTNLALAPNGNRPRFCELHGKLKQPQFQRGQPPFHTEGRFTFDADGTPQVQRHKELPVVITIPKTPMPAKGYPLMLYFHGSGGYSTQAVHRGKITSPGGENTRGEGPSHVVAASGIATAASALPVNPERLKNATNLAYLNLGNLAAYKDTFRQGAIEARLLIDALLRLRIPKQTLDVCQGPTLPEGEIHLRFSPQRLSILGQSLGATYAAMVGAIDPRVGAVIPTGGGGFWSYLMTNSNNPLLQPKVFQQLLKSTETLVYTHPLLVMLQTAWEAADPVVYAPRLSQNPLPSHPPRHIFQPIGQGDTFHPETIMDIMATAYGNQQVGPQLWPGTQQLLQLQNQHGLAQYPVQANRSSQTQAKYTAAVAQVKADPITKDGHYVAYQHDSLIYQYRCFLHSFIQTGTATLHPPSPQTSCPP